MRIVRLVKNGLSRPGDILPYVVGKLNPESRWRREVFKIGAFFSFSNEGFAYAKSIPELMTRNYYEEAYIRRLLAGRRFAQSLEIGCGFGRLSPVIAEFAEKHLALDINESALKQAKQHFPGIRFELGSATKLPLPDRAVDLVFTWTVLQHIPAGHFEEAIAEIKRVRTKDACILICEAVGETDAKGGHTFGRSAERYAAYFKPLRMTFSGVFKELEANGVGSPGLVMFFEP